MHSRQKAGQNIERENNQKLDPLLPYLYAAEAGLTRPQFWPTVESTHCSAADFAQRDEFVTQLCKTRLLAIRRRRHSIQKPRYEQLRNREPNVHQYFILLLLYCNVMS